MRNIGKIKHPERRFFLLTAYWFILISLIGFGPAVYFRDYSKASNFLIFHGIFFTIWIFIYLTQCYLISNKKIKWHMLLGKTSMVILVIVLFTTYGTVLYKMAEGKKTFLHAASNILEITMGFIMVWIAVYFRKQPYKHKRIMLTAMAFLTGAAASRACENLGLGSFGPSVIAMSVMPLGFLIIFDLLLFRKLRKLGIILLIFTLLIKFSRPYRLMDNDFGKTLIDGMMTLFLGSC